MATLQSTGDGGLVFLSQWHVRKAVAEQLGVDNSVCECVHRVVAVALVASCELREHEVVRFEAPTGCAARVLVAKRDEALLPPSRRLGRLWGDAMRVNAVFVVESGCLAERSLDEVSVTGIVARETSASGESSNSRGARKREPRMAWLPTMTMSLSPETSADARMMCSRSARFINASANAADDRETFLIVEDAGERCALTQVPHPWRVLHESLQELLQWSVKEVQPCLRVDVRDGGVLVGKPPIYARLRAFHDSVTHPLCDESMQLDAAQFRSAVSVGHGRSRANFTGRGGGGPEDSASFRGWRWCSVPSGPWVTAPVRGCLARRGGTASTLDRVQRLPIRSFCRSTGRFQSFPLDTR